MPTTITFAKVQDYLDALLSTANGNIGNSPHDAFWRTMTYVEFTTGNVPFTGCHGQPIKIIDPTDNGITDPNLQLKSPFYLVLLPPSFCSKNQMPSGGAFATDPGYTATLPDGTVITGQKILDNIREWLVNGFPVR